MAKQKTKRPTEEERLKGLLDSALREIKEDIVFGIVPRNPTRHFAKDERVMLGAHREVYIREVCQGGLYYLVECIGVQRVKNEPPANETHYVEWQDLFKYNQDAPTSFRKEDKYHVRFLNSSINSLFCMVYRQGVDFDVDYQREHVWTLDDKVALIDSIFNNIDIGKFVFAQRSMGHEGKLYEIIDGKQRLTALCEFYEGRFKYKGFTFAELSNSDKQKIEGHGVSYGYLENPSRRAIFETFIKLNTSGRPMKNEDIDKVKTMLNELG